MIDAFKKAEVKPMESTAKKTIQRLRIWQEDREALETIFEQLKVSPDSTQMEKLGYLVAWIKEQLERPLEASSNVNEVSSTDVSPEAKSMETEQAKPVVIDEGSAVQPFLSSLEETLKQLTTVISVLAQQQQQQGGTPQAVRAITPTSALEEQVENSTSPSSTATQAKPEQQTRKKGDIADEKLLDIMHRIFAYNDTKDRRHSEKWAVTIGLLKHFVKSQPRLQKFLKDHEPELTAHYQTHQIDPATQNYNHRGTSITDFIDFG